MKDIKFLFGVVITVCLLLTGCGGRQSADGVENGIDAALAIESAEGLQEIEQKTQYGCDADYLIDKESTGKGVFVSEHLNEVEVFTGRLLIETVESRGSISEDKKQYFSDWAMEQLKQIRWELLEEGWRADTAICSTAYTLNYLYGNVGYDFSYSFYRAKGKSISDKMQSVNVQAFIDGNGIIRGIDMEIGCEGERNVYDVKDFGIGCMFYNEFQENVIKEGIVYEGKIVYGQEERGLLSSGDAALSAEAIGKIIIDVSESGSLGAVEYRDLFDSESFFQMFQEQKWNQLGASWKANRYYDCDCILNQRNGYIGFLYYFYPDYEAMDVETAKALTFRCTVDIDDGKLGSTELRIYPMTKEEYQTAREWAGRRIAVIENGEITGGGGNIPIPVSESSEEKQRHIYTNHEFGEYSLCELLMEDLGTGNIEDGKISEFITDKESGWLSDLADESRGNMNAGWRLGEKYDFYYINHNEQAEKIHYRYYFYWNKAGEERERVLAIDAWISEKGLEEMAFHWFMRRRNFINDVSQESREEMLKKADIEAFLNFDWTTEQVLMWDHTIEPLDSAQGWEFSVADIDFDDRQEMLISFPSNHCGENSLYIYKQENGNVFSYTDTIATPERYMLTGIDYKEISPYMDIELLDIYVNDNNEYKYLSLDCSSFGGDFHGGTYTVTLYETVFGHGEEPKEIARIDYCGPEESEELYFLGEKVYERGKLRDMIALYMAGYTEVAVNYRTAEKTFARDVVAVSAEEKKQELDELYESLRSMIIK